MVHAGYVGYWWELYRTVAEFAPTKTLMMDDDLGELIRVSEQIAGTAEVIGIDSTPMVQLLLQLEDCNYGTGSTLPAADAPLELWLTRVRLALTEQERTDLSPVAQAGSELSELTAPYNPSPPAPPPKPFEFADINKQPVVNGKQKPFLTQAEHDILKELEAAGLRGLTKDQLDKQSGHTEARKYLKKLAADPDWRSVIVFPDKSVRSGYRLRFS